MVACSGADHPAPVGDPEEIVGSGGAGGSAGAEGAPGPGSGSVFHVYKVGDTLPGELTWQGFPEGSTELTTLALADYHDPTGAKGINALLITEGSPTCGPCIVEAKDLPPRLAGQWGKLGVRVLQLMIDNGHSGTATSLTAQQWKNSVKATWAVGVDADFTFAELGSNPLPIQIVVDPRTLKVVARLNGYQATLPAVDELAESNQ
jgi:hypothetical protein